MYSNIRKKTAAMGCLGWTIAIIGCLVLIAGAVWLDLFLATLLWSSVMCPIFNLPVLSMWQMFCVKVALWFCMPTRIHTVKTN